MRCNTEKMNPGHFWHIRNAVDASPEYQREAGVWGREKQQLFLDTLFNGYDLPKIYLHALKINGGLHDYALVDGKQRLQCIWDFMGGDIPLGPEFEHNPVGNFDRHSTPYPKGGDYYSDLSEYWQAKFRNVPLDVVVIQDAEVEDIEEIFSRLNNGEPLNSAEKRNAFGGNMCGAIRDLARTHKFFKETVLLRDKRFQYFDFAARFLLIEHGIKNGAPAYRDLKKRFLDALVRDNKNMSDLDIKDLKKRVVKQLNSLVKVFNPKDPALKQAGYPQLYYLFVKEMEENYADARLYSRLKEFIPAFTAQRVRTRKLKPEQKLGDDKHVYLDEFERLMQQGNDESSLRIRVRTMRSFFLLNYPSVKFRDPNRNFTEAERYAIFVLGGEKCAECNKPFNGYDNFQADHMIQWAHGGATTLDNARALCKPCNAKGNKKVA